MTLHIETLGLGFNPEEKDDIESVDKVPETESVFIDREQMQPDLLRALENLAAQVKQLEANKEKNSGI